MAAVFFHNLCISVNKPCRRRWNLSVKKLDLPDVETSWIDDRQSKERGSETGDVNCDYLWRNH